MTTLLPPAARYNNTSKAKFLLKHFFRSRVDTRQCELSFFSEVYDREDSFSIRDDKGGIWISEESVEIFSQAGLHWLQWFLESFLDLDQLEVRYLELNRKSLIRWGIYLVNSNTPGVIEFDYYNPLLQLAFRAAPDVFQR